MKWRSILNLDQIIKKNICCDFSVTSKIVVMYNRIKKTNIKNLFLMNSFLNMYEKNPSRVKIKERLSIITFLHLYKVEKPKN